MRLAIISDIHDNLWNLDIAMPSLSGCDQLICCGDLCSPFVIDELAAGFQRDIHIVFGNNDADLFRITSKTKRYPQIHLYGELAELTLAGKRFAVNHFDYIARPLAQSGQYDVVCFGHNHEFEITKYGAALALNPGSILGAKFGSGRREDVAPTFLIFDVEQGEATGFEIGREGGVQRK